MMRRMAAETLMEMSYALIRRNGHVEAVADRIVRFRFNLRGRVLAKRVKIGIVVRKTH